MKTHGVKGELNVELSDYADPEEDFAPGACVVVEIDGLDVPFFVAGCRGRGSESVLLSLDDLDSDADAAQLVGLILYVYADPEEISDDMTAGELIGYMLRADGRKVGPIDDLVELTPGAFYFSVDGRLIPAVDEFIRGVDTETRTVDVSLPQGLLEL